MTRRDEGFKLLGEDVESPSVVPVTDIQHTPPTPAQVDRLIELLCPDIEKKQILEKAA